jgi:hypothetical protein
MGPMLFRFPKLPPGVSDGTLKRGKFQANTLRRLKAAKPRGSIQTEFHIVNQ